MPHCNHSQPGGKAAPLTARKQERAEQSPRELSINFPPFSITDVSSGFRVHEVLGLGAERVKAGADPRRAQLAGWGTKERLARSVAASEANDEEDVADRKEVCPRCLPHGTQAPRSFGVLAVLQGLAPAC